MCQAEMLLNGRNANPGMLRDLGFLGAEISEGGYRGILPFRGKVLPECKALKALDYGTFN